MINTTEETQRASNFDAPDRPRQNPDRRFQQRHGRREFLLEKHEYGVDQRAGMRNLNVALVQILDERGATQKPGQNC